MEDTLRVLANKQYLRHTSKKETIYSDISINKVELETRYNDWINEEKIIATFNLKAFKAKSHQAQML